jgi:nucleotidyltransferase/DNA polymerase involved in DNA repair
MHAPRQEDVDHSLHLFRELCKSRGLIFPKSSYIIAVSPEARKLGLKRGQPFFKCQEIIRKHDVQVFSSNYSLYQELSARVMAVLAEFSPLLG